MRVPILGMVLALALAAPAPAADRFAGVNVVNPQWRSAAARTETIAQLVRYGVRTIRVPLARPYDVSKEFIRQAAKAGLGILLIVPLYDPQAIRAGAIPRDGRGETWDEYPLTAVDPAKLKTSFAGHLADLEASGIRFVGFEVGNEINWGPFNGSFPFRKSGRLLDLSDLTNDPEGQAIARSYDNYLQLLGAVKAVRDESRLNGATPIISAGLARAVPGPWMRRQHFDAVSIHATLTYLKARGLDALVDAYGIHAYLGTKTPWPKQEKLWDAILQDCGPAARGGTKSDGKTCWITEWGLRNPEKGCHADDTARAAAVRRTLGYFESAATGRLARAFYFNWNGDKGGFAALRLVRCGRLTAAGKALVSERTGGRK